MTRQAGARMAAAAVTLGLVSLVAGCGLPEGGAAHRIPGGEVPYGLLATTAAARPTTPTAQPTAVVAATVYLVDAQQQLVPASVQVPQASLVPLLQSLLDRLAAGPNEPQRARGLQTDLGPGAKLTLRSVSFGTAVIELRTASQDPSPKNLPVAIGQIVLTATSVIGVEQVSFVLDGNPASVPAPPVGDLSALPLSEADYLPLLAPGHPVPPPLEPMPPTLPVPDGSPTSGGTPTAGG